MTPPMVGPTWPRVHSTLGSDCLPALSQGTALLRLDCGLTARYLHCCRAYPMSRDWGCISTYCLSSYAPVLVYAALGAIPTVTCTSTPMVVCIPWWTLPYAFDIDSSPPMPADVPWGFHTIPLLTATVLGSRYFSDWYDNIGRCGL